MTRQPSVWHVLKFLIMKWHFSYLIYRTSTAIKRKPHHSDSNPACSSTGGAKRARTSSESSAGGYSSHLVKTMTKAASVSRYVTRSMCEISHVTCGECWVLLLYLSAKRLHFTSSAWNDGIGELSRFFSGTVGVIKVGIWAIPRLFHENVRRMFFKNLAESG